MESYNGFTGAFRAKQYEKMKRLRTRGEIPDWSKQPCEICGLPPERGMIMCHSEDYNDIHHFYPLCVECHMRLHRRFKDLTGWVNHLLAIRDAGYQGKPYHSVYAYIKDPNPTVHDFPDDCMLVPRAIGNEWFHTLSI